MRPYIIAFFLSYSFLKVGMTPLTNGQCQFVNGYVREGNVVDCICEDSDPQVSDVFWYSSNPEIIEETTSNQRSAHLRKIFTRKYNFDTIECVSLINETRYNQSYRIQIAYGPDRVSMALEPNSNLMDICPNCTIFIKVECQSSESFPSQITSIYMNGTLRTNNNVTNITQVDEGGPLNITCVSRNSAYLDMFATDTAILTVREPPTSPPIMTIDGYHILTATTVVEGMHQIVCRVDGGYPLVDNVTVTCGSHLPVSEQSNEVNTSFIITRALNGSNCSCWASHVTGHYSLTANFMLNVQYGPEINAFTANDITDALHVSTGALVIFVCRADGNPEPVMNIFSNNTTSDTKMSHLSFTKKLECNDTDNYTCHAMNFIGTSARSISITVLCPGVDLPNSSEDKTKIIVAVVVPIVILVIIIVTVIVVIIYCRRFRAKRRAPTNQSSRSSPNNVNTEHPGIRKSGSYSELKHDSQTSVSPYVNISFSKNGERNAFEIDSTISPKPCAAIIPVTPDVLRHDIMEDKLTKTENRQPPDLPVKIDNKTLSPMRPPDLPEKIGTKNLSPLKPLGFPEEIDNKTPSPMKFPDINEGIGNKTLSPLKPPDLPAKTGKKGLSILKTSDFPEKIDNKTSLETVSSPYDTLPTSRLKTIPPTVEINKAPPIPSKTKGVNMKQQFVTSEKDD